MCRFVFTFFVLFFSGKVVAQEHVQVFDDLVHDFLNVRDFTISKEGDEAYFSIQSPSQEISQIVITKMKNGKWSQPEILPFCDENQYLEPFLSDDGRKLYFASNRPNSFSTQNFDVWFVERKSKKEKWSDPQNIGSPVNTELNEFYPTLTKKGNLYFTLDSPNGLGKDDIYFSEWNGKNYSVPQILSANINSSGYEFNAFVSPNEDLLIFTKHGEKDGYGSGDLYFSRKDSKREWSIAENMGLPINTKKMEYCPFYDFEAETLYFTSKRESLEKRKFLNLSDFQQYINSGENGLSKIYKVKIKL